MTKKVSKESKQALVELVRREIEEHKSGKRERFSSNQELAYILGIARGNHVFRYLKELEKELRDYREREIGRYSGKAVVEQGKGIHRINSETGERFCVEHVRGLITEHKGIHRINSETGERFCVEHGKRAKALGLGCFGTDPQTGLKWAQIAGQKGGSAGGIATSNSYRKNAYHVENRFYASSQQEGAVALLFEKYLPNYEINEGKDFQVNDKGINNGGLDFLTDREFLEWHPIILAKGRRGDIPKAEVESYFKVLNQLSNEEKKQFQEDYKQVLALNYRNKRQSTVNNSGYFGLNVILATNERELYDFMTRYRTKLPSYEDFRKEFRKLRGHVKTWAVHKEKIKEAA